MSNLKKMELAELELMGFNQGDSYSNSDFTVYKCKVGYELKVRDDLIGFFYTIEELNEFYENLEEDLK